MRYPGQGPRGVMHSEVSWAGFTGVMLSEVSCAGSTGSHAQWGIMGRVHRESCSVRYPGQGPRGVMHSEVSWAGSTGSHAQ